MKGGRYHGPALDRPRLLRCHACGKVWAPTKEEARRLRAAVTEAAGESNPVRYYLCEAGGGWHWTSRRAQ